MGSNKGTTLLKDFLRYVGATMVSLLVYSLYAMVDGFMVSYGVGEYAMSAVNLTLPYTNLLFAIGVMFAVGASTIIAIYKANDQLSKANQLFSQNLLLLLFIGLTISVLVFLFEEPIGRMLGANVITREYVRQYLLGLAPFACCYMMSYHMEVLIKVDGYPQLSLLNVVIGAVANCVLDYIAIFHLGLGVLGAAVATGLSQLLVCVLFLRHFVGGHNTFHLSRFRFDWRVYRRLLPIGVSDASIELCSGAMVLLFNRTLLRYVGQDGVVSYTVIAYVNTLLTNLMVGVAQGTQPLLSFSYGKRARAECHRLLRYGLVTVAVLSAASFAGLYLFAPQVVGVYLTSATPQLLQDSIRAFRSYAPAFGLMGFNIFAAGYLTAQERSRCAIFISVGRGFVVQGAALLVIAAVFGGGAIWRAPVLSEVLCLVLSVFFLRQYLRDQQQWLSPSGIAQNKDQEDQKHGNCFGII